MTPRPPAVRGNQDNQLLFPVLGSAVVSSGFGWRLHPVLRSWLMHAGRDIAAPEGTPVVASRSGIVLSSGLAGGYGLAIELEHRATHRRTLYGHLSELYVRSGDAVQQGEVIGRRPGLVLVRICTSKFVGSSVDVGSRWIQGRWILLRSVSRDRMLWLCCCNR